MCNLKRCRPCNGSENTLVLDHSDLVSVLRPPDADPKAPKPINPPQKNGRVFFTRADKRLQL